VANTTTYIDKIETALQAWTAPEAKLVKKIGILEEEIRDIKASGVVNLLVKVAPREALLSGRAALENTFSVSVAVVKVMDDYDYATFQAMVDFVDAMIEELKKVKFHFVSFDPYAASAEPTQKNTFWGEATFGFVVVQ
jgi:hypothetical protein